MSNFNNEIIKIVSKINHLRYVDKNIDSIQYYYNELYELTKKNKQYILQDSTNELYKYIKHQKYSSLSLDNYFKIFKGIDFNIFQKNIYNLDDDIRISSFEEYYNNLEKYSRYIDNLYLKIIKDNVSHNHHNKNLSYIDYNFKDKKKIHNYIEHYIIPLILKFFIKQSNRINNCEIKKYNRTKYFNERYPIPKYKGVDLVEKIKDIYKENLQFNLLDFKYSINNSINSSFCTIIDKNKNPYISITLNNSWYDIKTITHEFGHALNLCYQSKNLPYQKIFLPTSILETLSISSEFIIWKHLDEIIDDSFKYKIIHLGENLNQLLEYIISDKFETFIYMNNDSISNPSTINRIWKKSCSFSIDNKRIDFSSIYGDQLMWKDNYLLFDKPFSSFDYAIAIVRSLFQISLSKSEETENLISYKNSLNKEPEKNGKTLPSILSEKMYQELYIKLSKFIESY